MLTSILLDLAVIAIIVISFFIYSHKGFFASLLTLVGTLASVVFAVLVANALSPTVFERFFQENLERQTMQAIGQQSVDNLSDLIRSVLGFLPDSIVEQIVEGLGTTLDFSAADIASEIVAQVIAPILIPIISIIVFFVVFALLKVLISILSALLTGVNKVPLLGTANRLLGGVIGVGIGCLYVFLLMCVLWAIDSSTGGAFAGNWFESSLSYGFMEKWNIFAA